MRTALAVLLLTAVAYGQPRVGPASGTLILHGGGGQSGPIIDRFVELAGGEQARLVFIPTAAYEVQISPDLGYNPDTPLDSPAGQQFLEQLQRGFGRRNITVLHTRDRRVAALPEFLAPLREATGVWIGQGNAGRLAQAYLNTPVQQELAKLLARGGVIAGSSAGAIIMGSFIVRGRPDKPLLMPKGHQRGFGFLKDVVINPHLFTAKREAELVNVLDAYPKLLGVGIDEDTAVEIHADLAEVIGRSKVAIYDNKRHGSTWYYVLEPGTRFHLGTRSIVK